MGCVSPGSVFSASPVQRIAPHGHGMMVLMPSLPDARASHGYF
jgi:hypothetical protein